MTDTHVPNAIVTRKAFYLRDADKYEKELAEEALENQTPPEESQDNKESHDWKKRYSDLKSHTDKTLNKVNSQIEELNKKLEAESAARKEAEKRAKELTLPASLAELSEWDAQFPELSKIITTKAKLLAKEIASEETEELKKQVNELKSELNNNKSENGKKKLLELHPDAFELENDEKFLAWYHSQPKRIKELFASEDYLEIAEGLSLYKLKMGIKTGVEKAKQASAAVVTNSQVKPEGTKKVWKESEVHKMPARLYEKYESEIDAARREGRFEYD